MGSALKDRAEALEAKGEVEKAKEVKAEAVGELGEALKRVPPEHALAAEIRQMLNEELLAALKQVPPEQSLAEKIRDVLKKCETPKKSGKP